LADFTPTTKPASAKCAKVDADFKEDLQKLLEARSGLTREFVFPTSWHKPHLENFATSHRRLCAF
jgi:hypothetical protein